MTTVTNSIKSGVDKSHVLVFINNIFNIMNSSRVHDLIKIY